LPWDDVESPQSKEGDDRMKARLAEKHQGRHLDERHG
jgi:hypothetical protein